MNKHLVEIKARVRDAARTDELRKLLLERGADFRGTDHQVDTYFNVPDGRLKLREGNIERSLIYYERPNQAGPKDSRVALTSFTPGPVPDGLRDTLLAALGSWMVVDKRREIYFIDNVKFHLDKVVGLGYFVEIEAIGETEADRSALLAQCQTYVKLLDIDAADLIKVSYSDLLSPATS